MALFSCLFCKKDTSFSCFLCFLPVDKIKRNSVKISGCKKKTWTIFYSKWETPIRPFRIFLFPKQKHPFESFWNCRNILFQMFFIISFEETSAIAQVCFISLSEQLKLLFISRDFANPWIWNLLAQTILSLSLSLSFNYFLYQFEHPKFPHLFPKS